MQRKGDWQDVTRLMNETSKRKNMVFKSSWKKNENYTNIRDNNIILMQSLVVKALIF